MDPFSQAFNLLKADHLINTYGEDFVLDILAKAMPGDPQIEALRQFVLMNDDTEDPELRAEVEAAFKYLTDISSGREAQMPHIRGYQAGGRGMTTPTPASSGPTPATYPRAEEKDMPAKSEARDAAIMEGYREEGVGTAGSPLTGARGGTVPVRPPKGRDSRTSMRGRASPDNPMDPPRPGSGKPDPERPKPFDREGGTDVKLAGTAISQALAHLGF